MPFIWLNNGIRIPADAGLEIKTQKIPAVTFEKIQTQFPSNAQEQFLAQHQSKPMAQRKSQPQSLPGQISFANRLAQRTYDKNQQTLPGRHKVILAEEIMSSPVITLPPSTTLSQAWALIRDHRFRHIPIVNAEGFPLGILSDRNLLREAVALGRDVARSDDANDPNQTIGNLISGPVLTALPHAEIHQIAKTLFEHHIGAMPIIDDQNRLIGIITRSDVLRALVHLGPLELWS